MSALDTLTAEHFEACLGRTLQLCVANASAAVRVTEVRRMASHSHRLSPPFSVLLRADGIQPAWPQGIYRLDLPEFGAIDVLVVPVAADAQGSSYEIVFN